MSKPKLINKNFTSSELNILFKQLMGNGNVSLFPFQEKVALSLLSGKNIILRAPTGSGKTWAALMPFLYALREEIPFVDRILYALPLRSLASQLYSTTLNSCSAAGWEVFNKADYIRGNRSGKSRVTVTIQTGEQQNDSFFQGDIIFTTIDQLLSSYIFNPVSLPGKLSNINAGALLGSLIVFDEFHLLDPELSMGTAIEMMDRLLPFSRFLIMTATLSEDSVSWLSSRLGNVEVVNLEQSEVDFIESKKQCPTVRSWSYVNEPLTAEEVLARFKPGQRTLVLINTVRRAQEFYKDLCDKVEAKMLGNVTLCLLHSRFYPEDRDDKECQVINFLGKDQQTTKVNFILVSTQVVEAGMDFSADVLHSELAPINSLVQRAGRCARYGGEGSVYIYPVEGAAPYSSNIMQETEKTIKNVSGKVFSFMDEKELVNKVHGNIELQKLQQYNNLYQRRQKVCKAMGGILKNATAELIRDINSINVLVTGQPERVRFDLPGKWPEMLSIPMRSLRSFLDKVQKQNNDSKKWIARYPVFTEQHNEDLPGFSCEWHDYSINDYPWLIAINPCYAHYSPQLGLVLGEAGGEKKQKYRERDVRARYHYRCETFQKHLSLVFGQHKKMEAKNKCALRYLSNGLNIPAGVIKKAVQMALLFHDIGKLSKGWQGPAKAWQEYKTPGCVPKEPLAHTDYDPDKNDWVRQKEYPKRADHAVEGAFAIHQYLYNVFESQPEIAACIFTAIARHHSGWASSLNWFSLIPSALDVMNDCLRDTGFRPIKNLMDNPEKMLCGKDGEFAAEMIIALYDQKWLPLYFFIVRCLRLSDQAGTMEGGMS